MLLFQETQQQFSEALGLHLYRIFSFITFVFLSYNFSISILLLFGIESLRTKF